MTHQPPTRTVYARVLTTAGWLRAGFTVPVAQPLLDHLEHSGAFLSTVDAELPGWNEPVPSFALQRRVISLVVPDSPELIEPAPVGPGENHKARFVLEHGYLVGQIRLLKGTRLSSFISHREGFFVVRDARLHRSHDADPVHLPQVVVNGCRLIGVVDIG
jgi:hypothetical protein